MSCAPLRRRMAMATAGVAFLAGCAGKSTNAGPPPTAASTTPPPTTTTTTIFVPADLRTVIFEQLPVGYVEEPAGYDLDGPLDLVAAAKYQASTQDQTKEQTDLTQHNFKRGYERAWVVKGTNKTLIIRVLLLGSSKQALDYFNGKTFADATDSNLTTFPTPGLSASAGFSRTFTDSYGARSEQFVDLARGPFVYHIGITGAPGSVLPSAIVPVAQGQNTKSFSQGFT